MLFIGRAAERLCVRVIGARAMDEIQNLITARDAATLLGCHKRTAGGRPTNHSKFLARLHGRYPAEFPVARWLADRKYFELCEVLAFKEGLPRRKTANMKAAA